MRLLVIKPSSLGDIVHGLLVVSKLRRNRPDVSIDWVVRAEFVEVVRASRLIDEVIVYDRKGGIRSFISTILQIRRGIYDMVWDMQGLARSGLMTLAARSRCKIGRSDSRELAGLAYGQKVKYYPGKSAHAVDILRPFLLSACDEDEISGRVDFTPDESENFLKLLNSLPSNEYLCLFPGSRRKEKRWPYFVQLTRLLLTRTSFMVLWLGDSCCTDLITSDRLMNLCGDTTIGDVINFIKKARLVVANDSGPMHLAAALGIPVLGLFITTDPKKYGPYPSSSRSNFVLSKGDKDEMFNENVVFDKIMSIIENGYE
ncbi:MAG: glycosyltransferase family 9 protein [Puniceicoccales bacterium]|jgi:lipopolysaccharide heptosyltransferase I|nr:glycosyltransferase family 9 protein [Puniceicoccales bacterium]